MTDGEKSSDSSANPPFSLDDVDEEDCEHLFRFRKVDIPRLIAALKLPNRITCSNGTVIDAVFGVCFVLRRLAYPNRFKDIMSMFGKSEPELSIMFNECVDIIHEKWARLLLSLDKPWVKLAIFSEAVKAKSPLDKCIGFIPSTTSLIGYYHLSVFHYLGSPPSYHTLIFDLMSSRNMYLYNAYIYTYILLMEQRGACRGQHITSKLYTADTNVPMC